MIQIKINNKEVSVPAGTSVLNAARALSIDIPTMCHLEGLGNHPSCMVCMVKDARTGNLFPSCAMPVEAGMEVITDDDEVRSARKDALELLLSDHVGDCEAPCRVACPAFMDIPKMNRLIASGNFHEALKVVKEEIALPYILGHICSAPCEKVCRRKQVDSSVSICLLKRFVAQNDLNYSPDKNSATGKKVAIIGAGPAGLSCAFYLLKLGHSCTIYDSNQKVGGSLLSLQDDELPKSALNAEVDILKRFGANFKMGITVSPEMLRDEILHSFDAVVFSTGEIAKSNLNNFGFQLSKNGLLIDENTFVLENKIFACGSTVHPLKMAVKAVAQGKEAAFSVNKFLSGESVSNRYDRFNSKFGLLQTSEIAEYLEESENKNDIIKPKNGKLSGFIEEEAILEAKRCMHCDCRKPESCKLRLYADEYNVDRKKYSLSERKTLKKYLQHDLVVYEPEKCIRCGLCIEITSKNKELTGLTYIGRGFDVKIDIPFSRELSQALVKSAKECVDACPTGAISLKG